MKDLVSLIGYKISLSTSWFGGVLLCPTVMMCLCVFLKILKSRRYVFFEKKCCLCTVHTYVAISIHQCVKSKQRIFFVMKNLYLNISFGCQTRLFYHEKYLLAEMAWADHVQQDFMYIHSIWLTSTSKTGKPILTNRSQN